MAILSMRLMTKVLAGVIFTFAFTSCGLLKDLFSESSSPRTGTHHETHEKWVLRRNIVDYAEDLLGSRYRYGGRSPAGFDCSGFTSYVLNEYGISVSGPSYAQENMGKKIREAEAQPGDLVFFRKSKTGKVFHVAMVYDNDGGDLTLIHSTSTRGVVKDKMSESSYWRSKVMTLRNVIGE